MKLIVGLGNPGTKYEKTRHNVGFMVVEQFLKDFTPVGKTVWEDSVRFKSDIAEFEWNAKHGALEKIILVKPKTYMNNSGLAVHIISQYLKILISDLWIIHDDVDLPLGAMKIRLGGASAGHRGVQSVIDTLKTDAFWRFRLGIGHPRNKSPHSYQKFNMKGVDEYVLRGFTGAERGKSRELVKKGAKALSTALELGLPASMNRFNAK